MLVQVNDLSTHDQPQGHMTHLARINISSDPALTGVISVNETRRMPFDSFRDPIS